MKKKIAYLLAAMMFLSAFTACSSGSGSGASSSAESGASAASSASQTASKSGSPESLVVSIQGFNDDKMLNNVFHPFEEKYNAKITFDYGNNGERLTKLEQTKGKGIDLVFFADYFAQQAADAGLLEKIDRSKIPNIDQLYDSAKAPIGEDYGPAFTFNRIGIVYDTTVTNTPVTSWADLWRSEFKQKIAIPDITTTAGPYMVFISADQLGISDVTDESAQEKLFGKLKEMTPNVLKYYTKSSDVVNMFHQKEIGAAVMQDFAFGSVQGANSNCKWVDPKEGSFSGFNTMNVVKGSEHKELAEEFINFMISKDIQYKEASDRIDSPANKTVVLTADQGKNMTYGADLVNSLNTPSCSIIIKMNKTWTDLWNSELATN